MNWNAALDDTARGLAFLGVFAAMILVAKLLEDLLSPRKVTDELAARDNPALGVAMAGYYLALAIIFVGVVAGPSAGFLTDLYLVALYSAVGLVFLTASRLALDQIIFRRFVNPSAIVEGRNLAAGTVRGAFYIATGFVSAGSLAGEDGGILTSLVFFALGQAALFIFAKLYDVMTPFAVREEIENGNLAAGVAFGGSIIALGLILGRAVSGAFLGWAESLGYFALQAVIGIVLLQVVRLLMDKVLLPGHKLNKEIAGDRNVSVGMVEAGIAVAFAVVLTALI